MRILALAVFVALAGCGGEKVADGGFSGRRYECPGGWLYENGAGGLAFVPFPK